MNKKGLEKKLAGEIIIAILVVAVVLFVFLGFASGANVEDKICRVKTSAMDLAPQPIKVGIEGMTSCDAIEEKVDGNKKFFKFEKTPKMSTYLVYIAVGEFEFVEDKLDGIALRVYTTPGNHDYCLTRNLKNYHKYIDKNHIKDEDRYIIDYGNVSLFFMDSGPNYYSNLSILFEWHGQGLYDNDIEWLEDRLSKSQSKHKIVLMHHTAVGQKEDVFILNRDVFVELCKTYDVELVLAGHTHRARVFDSDLNNYDEFLLNCSLYPTLYVQSDDCREGIHYRNVSIKGNDVWLESSEELKVGIDSLEHLETQFMWICSNLFNKRNI
jgi:hypothetical protein